MNQELHHDEDQVDLIDLGAATVETLGMPGASNEGSRIGFLPGITDE